METVVRGKYPKTERTLSLLMKVVQRELEDGKLKVQVLSDLVDLKERIDAEGKESSGRG